MRLARGGPWEPAHGEATWARGRPGRAPRDEGARRQPLGGGCLGRKGDGLDWPSRQPGARPGRVSSVPSAQLCVRCRVGVSSAGPLLFFAGPLPPPRFGLGRCFNLGSGGYPLADRSLPFSLQMCSGAGWSGLGRVWPLTASPGLRRHPRVVFGTESGAWAAFPGWVSRERRKC